MALVVNLNSLDEFGAFYGIAHDRATNSILLHSGEVGSHFVFPPQFPCSLEVALGKIASVVIDKLLEHIAVVNATRQAILRSDVKNPQGVLHTR
jgi:hypothetical protein